MKLIREDVAIEFAKTLITSDQREILQVARERKMRTVDAIAITAFGFADAFIEASKFDPVVTSGPEPELDPTVVYQTKPKVSTKRRR